METYAGNGRHAPGHTGNIRAWRRCAETRGAASLKSLAPALVFLLFIASVDLLRAQDPAPSPEPGSAQAPAPAEAANPAPPAAAASILIRWTVRAGENPPPVRN